MEGQDLAIIEDEAEQTYNCLKDSSNHTYMAMNRNPDCTRQIINGTLNNVTMLKNNLGREKKLLKDPFLIESIDDRIRLLMRINELYTFKWDPNNVRMGYQPYIEDVATDVHLAEITIANLFCSVNYFLELLEGKKTDDIVDELKQILMDSEAGFSRHGSRSCLKSEYNHPAGRAKWMYSIELLAAKKYSISNVSEEIENSGNYSLLYGRKGILLQVKDKRVFRNRKSLQRIHRATIANDATIYFPVVREFFKDVIPTYTPKNVV